MQKNCLRCCGTDPVGRGTPTLARGRGEGSGGRTSESILMSPRGGVNRRIWTLIKIFNPLSVLKPVRPVSKNGQTGFTQTEPKICKYPLRVLAQTKLGVGLPQGFPRVPTQSLHTAQAHQSRSKRKHKIYARKRDKQQARYI
jgi:hypothetical protein